MYKNCISRVILSLALVFSWSTFSNKNKKSVKDIPVGKIEFLKGEVTALFPHTLKAITIKKGDYVFEDTSLLSKKRSFARIKLQDGSILTLGPDSKIVINLVDKEEANVISLLNGKIRAKVRKALDIEKAREDKFFIKTRVASVAVRGTEFMTTFNSTSKRTSVLTYEGEVAFKKLDKKDAAEVAKHQTDKKKLVETLKNNFKKEVELAKVGDFTTVGVVDTKPVEPVKVNHQQFALLKKDDSLGVEATKITKKEILEETKKAENLYQIKETVNREGLKQGGLIAAAEGFYIPPKNESPVGKVDSSGEYIPPKDLKLDPIRGFVPIMDSKEDSKKAEETREKAKELNENILKDQAIEDPDNPAYSRYFDL